MMVENRQFVHPSPQFGAPVGVTSLKFRRDFWRQKTRVARLSYGVVRSREPFKFWWAPIISLERLIVSGAVNLGGRSVW